MKLLILDDDLQIREGIQFSIDWASLGFEEVKSAGDGIAGMEIAQEFMPDIILSDVRMPGVDGLEFLRRIKELLPLAKVVLISGYDDFVYLQTAIKYKADAYELKPVNVRNLIKLVEELKEKILTEKNVYAVPDANPNDNREFSQRISTALDYIAVHFAETLSAVSMGELLRVTPNYFSALFKKELGQSFSAYLNDVRLRSAAYLLKHTGYLVYEIADYCGFHDYIYFSQCFKKAYGCSPVKYRSQARQENL